MEGKGISEVKDVIEFISKDMNKLGIDNLPAPNTLHDLAELKKYLASRISKMLDNDYDKLISALYMIDLDERRLHELFSGKNREFIPDALADLILRRQMEKMKWRKKYREGNL